MTTPQPKSRACPVERRRVGYAFVQTEQVQAVLVTGSSGQVGFRVAAALEAEGVAVRRLDVATGGDLRKMEFVGAAVAGVDAVVHAGAIPHDRMGSPEDIVATNLLGTPSSWRTHL